MLGQAYILPNLKKAILAPMFTDMGAGRLNGRSFQLLKILDSLHDFNGRKQLLR